ncbi:Crp/Fnr family transcriptional regulator [Paenibacillus aceris]|uniref:Cyclic nucleotide-binding domain-containing protein n=1 Tax=Paenibacillus aceris TaxID=869555 RepID=A0ABS4I1M1_9BACL|nr:Crp/Fnr family transcriptional regulator [Paenibacillus aceris]MBP1964816.1 hypothetical protein [Paenibacillus aceris]NHW33793.1 Crp/Fnr family transcriptional regulator [Paenibacillus aceris]
MLKNVRLIEVALLSQGPRTATIIRAEEDVLLWRLDSTVFYDMIFDQTSIAVEMMKQLSRSLRSELAKGPAAAEDSAESGLMSTLGRLHGAGNCPVAAASSGSGDDLLLPEHRRSAQYDACDRGAAVRHELKVKGFFERSCLTFKEALFIS